MNLDKEIAELLGMETNDPLGHHATSEGDYYRPSINTEQAIKLLNGMDYSLEKTTTGLPKPYRCDIYETGGVDSLGCGYAETPSEAICKAWISYKKGEKK